MVALITPITPENTDALVKLTLLNRGPCDQCGEPLPYTACIICKWTICEGCTDLNTEPPKLTCKKCSSNNREARII